MGYAIAAVACYGLAFPTFVFFKFYKNRKIIFEDQLLAAQDRGEKPISNPNYAFRKRYSSLYKNFKPKKWYWILCILARKLAICFIALMFRATPVFQLAIACSVVFAAFVGQLVNRPYMGMVERADVVMRASERDFNKGNKLLRKMSAFGESEDVEKAKKRLEMEQQAQIVTANALRESAKYFVNYNYVESFFICSIFVCQWHNVCIWLFQHGLPKTSKGCVGLLRHICCSFFNCIFLLCHRHGNYSC